MIKEDILYLVEYVLVLVILSGAVIVLGALMYDITGEYNQRIVCNDQFGESFYPYSLEHCQGIICEENGECREVIYKLDEEMG